LENFRFTMGARCAFVTTKAQRVTYV